MSPDTERKDVGLAWEGRWGRWASAAVNVLAACVGEFEVTVEHGAVSTIVERCIPDLRLELSAELPAGAAIMHIHRVGRNVGQVHLLKVALHCSGTDCKRLQEGWRRRVLCDGLAFATWISIADSASPTHGALIEKMLSLRSRLEDCFALELPIRWVMSFDYVWVDGLGTCTLKPGSHWWAFAALFGDVSSAELTLASEDSKTTRLLVRFLHVDGAYAALEALTMRYLHNPSEQNLNGDDTYPVACAVGKLEELRVARALPELRLSRPRVAEPSQSEAAAVAMGAEQSAGPTLPRAELLAGRAVPNPPVMASGTLSTKGFVLRRCGQSADKEAAPASFEVTPKRRRVVVGREVADVVLKRAHVSKAHAVFELREVADGPGWLLVLQDTSANGTWVNGRRLASGSCAKLMLGDRVSFLPVAHAYYPDALLYEVDLIAAGPSVRPCPLATSSQPAGRIAESASSMGPLEATLGRKRPSGSALGDRQAHEPKMARWTAAVDQVHVEAPARPPLDVAAGGAARAPVIDLENVCGGATRAAAEDISVWLRSLDGGSLVGYLGPLAGLFESVSQIRALYSDHLQAFYEDVGVTDPMHRLAFASALRALRQ